MLFDDIIINESVDLGDYDEDLSDEYISRLINTNNINPSTVVIVLVGSATYTRKHVDWEIYAGLSGKVGGSTGLIGILLPTFDGLPEHIPARLLDNINSGYALYSYWTRLYDKFLVQQMIHTAFERKNTMSSKINNRRKQMERNLSY